MSDLFIRPLFGTDELSFIINDCSNDDDDSPYDQMRRGEIAMKRGDRDEAIEWLTKAKNNKRLMDPIDRQKCDNMLETAKKWQKPTINVTWQQITGNVTYYDFDFDGRGTAVNGDKKDWQLFNGKYYQRKQAIDQSTTTFSYNIPERKLGNFSFNPGLNVSLSQIDPITFLFHPYSGPSLALDGTEKPLTQFSVMPSPTAYLNTYFSWFDFFKSHKIDVPPAIGWLMPSLMNQWGVGVSVNKTWINTTSTSGWKVNDIGNALEAEETKPFNWDSTLLDISLMDKSTTLDFGKYPYECSLNLSAAYHFRTLYKSGTFAAMNQNLIMTAPTTYKDQPYLSYQQKTIQDDIDALNQTILNDNHDLGEQKFELEGKFSMPGVAQWLRWLEIIDNDGKMGKGEDENLIFDWQYTGIRDSSLFTTTNGIYSDHFVRPADWYLSDTKKDDYGNPLLVQSSASVYDPKPKYNSDAWLLTVSYEPQLFKHFGQIRRIHEGAYWDGENWDSPKRVLGSIIGIPLSIATYPLWLIGMAVNDGKTPIYTPLSFTYGEEMHDLYDPNSRTTSKEFVPTWGVSGGLRIGQNIEANVSYRKQGDLETWTGYGGYRITF